MSRELQLTTSPKEIADDLGYVSVHVNSKVQRVPLLFLMALMQLLSSNRNQFTQDSKRLSQKFLTYISACFQPINTSQELVNLGANVTAVRKPTLFRDPYINSDVVVNAAMRGQEIIVLNILHVDPSYFLKLATVRNSVGVTSSRTLLQAAIMANDVQLVEKMQEHFARLTTDLEGNAIDGVEEMHRQMMEIYRESLQCYSEIQKSKFTPLPAQKSGLSGNDAEKTLITSLQKSPQQNTQDLLTAHTKAQKDNAFDFEPYIRAILNAPLGELDEVMALINAITPQATQDAIAKGVSPIEIGFVKNRKTYTQAEVQALPFSELPLIQKLNRFREKFVNHMRQEIIFNPHHILAVLQSNEKVWRTTPGIGNACNVIRNVIFTCLVGWAQRNAAEPVKQDIRQGTWYLTENNESHMRPLCFNALDCNYKIVRNSRADISLVDASVIDGVGYKFAMNGQILTTWSGVMDPGANYFSEYMLGKNIKLAELALRAASRVSEHHCA